MGANVRTRGTPLRPRGWTLAPEQGHGQRTHLRAEFALFAHARVGIHARRHRLRVAQQLCPPRRRWQGGLGSRLAERGEVPRRSCSPQPRPTNSLGAGGLPHLRLGLMGGPLGRDQQRVDQWRHGVSRRLAASDVVSPFPQRHHQPGIARQRRRQGRRHLDGRARAGNLGQPVRHRATHCGAFPESGAPTTCGPRLFIGSLRECGTVRRRSRHSPEFLDHR